MSMTPFAASVKHRPDPREGYDAVMYWAALEEYYEHSGFVNYGYWDDTTKGARSASERLMEQLLSRIPNKSGTILDVACGKGASSRYLLRYYPPTAVTAINISERQLATCRETAPGIRFLRMDAADLEFPDSSFDNIISVEAAFHFHTREKFFREAYRVLKPGGRLVLSDMLLTEQGEATRIGRHKENHVTDLAAYEALARRVGFTDTEVTDATEPCLHGCFWHLVEFSHRKLLTREIDPEGLRAFCRHFFGFVPQIRGYLLAAMTRPLAECSTVALAS